MYIFSKFSQNRYKYVLEEHFMNFFKKLFSDLMADDSNDDSSFVLSETTPDEKNNSNDSSNETKPQNVYPNLSVNLEYINSRFNSLINSDIKIREFLLHARNKQYHAFIVYIDGMSDSDSINDFIFCDLHQAIHSLICKEAWKDRHILPVDSQDVCFHPITCSIHPYNRNGCP